MTLMKSNTTRRSQPMIMSRLRRPTSKSMTTVFLPRWASPAPMAAVVVVLPTPPLPEVMTMILAKASLLLERVDAERIAVEIHLHPLLQQAVLEIIAGAVDAADRHQLRLEAVAEDARLGVAVGAGQRATAQRAVDMHVATRDHL